MVLHRQDRQRSRIDGPDGRDGGASVSVCTAAGGGAVPGVACSQSFSEETSSLSKKAITEIARRVSALEAAAPPSEAARMKWAADQEKLIKVGNRCAAAWATAVWTRVTWHCCTIRQIGTSGHMDKQPKHLPLPARLRSRSRWLIGRFVKRCAPPACCAAEQAGLSGHCCTT